MRNYTHSLALMAAVCVGGLALFLVGFFVALAVRSALADPGGPVPNPGHAWTELQDHGVSGSDYWLGTTDNNALELWVNNARALRLEPNATSPNVIGGYSGNSVATGVAGAAVCGGGSADDGLGNPAPNRVTDDYGTVGGGWNNHVGNNAGSTSDQPNATVGGGQDNTASGGFATVGGGLQNTASAGSTTVGGGNINTASGSWATVGGGYTNQATNDNATVGGGGNNTASGNDATVGGGNTNTASNQSATVGGGANNNASGDQATVGGGGGNNASGVSATVGGGDANTAGEGTNATVGGGHGNIASGFEATVGGGNSNTASGVSKATVAGGGSNTASGDSATVGGGGGNTASGDGATVGGGGGNTANNQSTTVGGGANNIASGDQATVGGGGGNTASGVSATVGGGDANTAGEGTNATVGGGHGNIASGSDATVGGGNSNVASGFASTVPGGNLSTAQGDYSFAAGRRAKANNQGCFAWSDSTDADVACNDDNRFIARASGGVYLYTSSDLSTGAYLAAGSGTWTDLSDRNLKDNFTPVNGQEVLASLAEIPITTWNYKAQDAAIRHMGPVAQDFYAAFGLGDSETGISTVDADGVALAAIQGLYQLSQEQAARIQALEEENANLQQRLGDLEGRVAALEEGGSTSAPAATGAAAGPLGVGLTPAWLLLGGLVVVGLVVVQRRRAGGRP